MMAISLDFSKIDADGEATYVLDEAVPVCYHGKTCEFLLIMDGPHMICKHDGRNVCEIYRNDRRCPEGNWWLMNKAGINGKNIREECDQGYTEVPEQSA